MELRHLRYFVAVAENLSFRRAAEQLHVAQPALSKQIKDLEQDVGARLLDRNTGGVMLTDAGNVFLDEARDILERVEMATETARGAADGSSGRLTIGNLGALSASFLPAALSAFRARYPKVEVNLNEMGIPEQEVALKSGAIQLGFTFESHEKASRDFDCTPILESRIDVALGSDHARSKCSRVSLADLADETFICVAPSAHQDTHQKRMEEIFATRGIKHRPLKRVNSFESLVALVAGNHGVSMMLPVYMAGNRDGVVFRRIKEDGDDLTVRMSAMVQPGGRSQLATNFVEVLRNLRKSSGK